jgi:hypothetical protein
LINLQKSIVFLCTKNKLNKQCKWPLQEALQTTEERYWRRLQKVERSPMLMDWQNQYCENGFLTKSNQYVQCNPHQNSNDVHHRDWRINHKVHLKVQETRNRQGNTEQKKQHWRYCHTWLQAILQSQSSQNSTVLAQN